MSAAQQKASAASAKKGRRAPRLRLMPFVMIAMLATISLKANHFWHGIQLSIGKASQAQAQPQANQNATQPAAAAPAQQAAQGQSPAQAAQAPQSQPAQAQTVQSQQNATPGQPAQTQQAATSGNAAAQPGATPPAPVIGNNGGPVTDLLAQEAKRKVARDPFNYTDEEVDVLQQLAKRRQELDQRARQLDEREALVKAAEQRMEQKMAELRALQATVEDLLKKRDAADEQQLASLVKIYENMKPKAAAQVFEEMDMDVLLDVVSRMSERKVAPILAQVSPTKAKEVTYELAQRRQLPMPQ